MDDTTDGDERLQSVCEHTGSHSFKENNLFSSQDQHFPVRYGQLPTSLSLESHLLMLCAPLVLQSQEAWLHCAGSTSRKPFKLTPEALRVSVLPEGHSQQGLKREPLTAKKVKKVKVTQSCPTLCDPMDYSPPGFSVHGILQARILEWGSHFLLQRIFPTQGSNPSLLCCRQILYR